MKKIFAIALALVMVLSMASAFAANSCSTFDWTCSTTATACGKAKVEVVPYVVVNNGCGSWEYQVSTCATAISSQNVFFAIKLTVDANVDQDWLDEAEVSVALTALKKYDTDLNTVYSLKGFDPYTDGANKLKKSEAQVWYLGTDGQWYYGANKNFDINTTGVVFKAEVGDARKAKVCATIDSDHNGVDTWKVGDYTVVVGTNTDAAGTITITKGSCGDNFVMSWVNGKVNKIEAKTDAFFAEVVSKFNLAGCVVGTCVDKDIIQRNFGWDDEFESCFSWSDKGASVVNPECVVTLPKTGDASLLWWLF